jgi:hypothetical protein
MWKDMLGIAASYPLAIDGLVTRYEDGRLAAIVVCDGQDGVISFRYGEVSDEVQCDGTKGYVCLLRGNWY